MSEDSSQIDRFDDRSLGALVVDGPRSLLLETKREVWWESELSIRRFQPPSRLESLVVYRLPNYFDELELPSFLGRYCLWNRSVEQNERVDIEQFALSVRVKHFVPTLSECDSLKRDLQAVVQFIVAEPASWEKGSAVTQQSCWKATLAVLRDASNRPPPPIQVCERFETDHFGSFVDVAVADISRIHQVL